MAYYGGGNAFGGFPGGGNAFGGFPGGGNAFGGLPGGGYPGGGNAFGGFPGGYSQSPTGIVPNANVGSSGAVYTLGTNLPSIDPNNYGGTVHFGPSTAYSGSAYGQYPESAGIINPNLGATGGANIYPGI